MGMDTGCASAGRRAVQLEGLPKVLSLTIIHRVLGGYALVLRKVLVRQIGP